MDGCPSVRHFIYISPLSFDAGKKKLAHPIEEFFANNCLTRFLIFV